MEQEKQETGAERNYLRIRFRFVEHHPSLLRIVIDFVYLGVDLSESKIVVKIMYGRILGVVFVTMLAYCHTVAAGGNTGHIDSLEQLLATDPSEAAKINTIVELARTYQYIDPEKGLEYGEQALSIAEQLDLGQYIAQSLNIIGENYHELSLYDHAIDRFKRALALFTELDDQKGRANCYGNMGLAESFKGNYKQALDCNIHALQIREKLGEIKLIGISLNNLGLLYYYMLDPEKSIECFRRALKTARDLGDIESIATRLNNIGAILQIQGRCREALIHYKKGLKIKIRLNDQPGIGSGLNNIGQAHNCSKNYRKAIAYYERSLIIKRELNDLDGIANGLRNIAEAYNELGEYDNCIKYLDTTLKVSKEIDSKAYVKEAYKLFAMVFGQAGEYDKALKYHKLFVEKQDSIFNEDKNKEIGKLEGRYEMEKKLEMEKRNAEEKNRVIQEAESRRDNLQYSGILIFIVLLGIGIFVLGRFSIPIRLAEGLVFFTFLLFFEFSLVLLDPYIERFSSGAPAIKLAFNAVLAGMIFPLHSFFEERLKKKLLKQ